jgi:hypothetical protein
MPPIMRTLFSRRMTGAGVLAAALVVGLTPATLVGQARTYRTRLSPVPVDTAMMATIAGSGQVTATLTGTRLTISGTFEGLKSPATVARLHRAQKGVRGPAVFDLVVANTPAASSMSGTLSATLDLTPTQVDDLGRERFYVQVHSEKAPEGNLWGWLQLQESKR